MTILGNYKESFVGTMKTTVKEQQQQQTGVGGGRIRTKMIMYFRVGPGLFVQVTHVQGSFAQV